MNEKGSHRPTGSAPDGPPGHAQGSGSSGQQSVAPGSELRKITVNLNRRAVRSLDTVSASTGLSKTDTINRALQVFEIIDGLMVRGGGSLTIRHANGDMERIFIL